MKRTISALLVAVTTAAALPALAADGDGNQTAKALGLPTNTFSMAQLTQLNQAKQDGDATTVRYILAHPAYGSAPASKAALNAEAQRVILGS